MKKGRNYKIIKKLALKFMDVYNDSMGTKSEQTFIEEAGEKKDALLLTFTNGSLQQLKDLAGFLKVSEPAQVVEKAIGIIQQVKEMEDKRKTDVPK